MLYNTSNVLKNAWKLARMIAKENAGVNPRDTLSYAMKEMWKQEKSPDIVATNLPIIFYHQGEQDGGSPIAVFVSNTHDDGSGTFWLENRGKGLAGQDDLDPNEYDGDWDDGTDYQITAAMQILSDAEALGPDVIWEPTIERPVYESKYNAFIMRGGNIYDLK